MGSLSRKLERDKLRRDLQGGAPDKHLMSVARDLAAEANRIHWEGVEHAADILNQAIEEEGEEARKQMYVGYLPFPTETGEGTIVSLMYNEDGKAPQRWQDIMVATKPDELGVTADSIGSVCGFTTRVMTIIDDEDGTQYASQLWKKQTQRII